MEPIPETEIRTLGDIRRFTVDLPDDTPVQVSKFGVLYNPVLELDDTYIAGGYVSTIILT